MQILQFLSHGFPVAHRRKTAPLKPKRAAPALPARGGQYPDGIHAPCYMTDYFLRTNSRDHAAMRTSLLAVFLFTISSSFAAGPKPFSLTISTPLPVVKSGAEVNVKIVITNSSSQPITIFKNNPACNYGLDVRDSKGNPMPMTKAGREADDCLKGLGVRITGRNIMATLKPNESTDEELNITALREMRRPGRYLVKVTRDIPKELGTGTVVSNAIAVTVEN